MKEEDSQLPRDRENLFQLLYGYPIRLAEQVVALGVLNDNLQQELVEFHAQRLKAVDELLGEPSDRG